MSSSASATAGLEWMTRLAPRSSSLTSPPNDGDGPRPANREAKRRTPRRQRVGSGARAGAGTTPVTFTLPVEVAVAAAAGPAPASSARIRPTSGGSTLEGPHESGAASASISPRGAGLPPTQLGPRESNRSPRTEMATRPARPRVILRVVMMAAGGQWDVVGRRATTEVEAGACGSGWC